MTKRLLIALAFLALTAYAHGGLVDPVIDGNELTATVEVGGLEAELTIRFENVVGLTPSNLGVSVHLLDPLSPELLGRLPGTQALGGIGLGGLLNLVNDLVTVPVGFPVMVRIDPPTDSGLTFEGVVEVELYTQLLNYQAATPLRLFKAPTGSGTFHDVTEDVSPGSIRTRSGGGHFSDFMIVLDLRAAADVVDEKFDRLGDLLVTHAGQIDATVYAGLAGLYVDAADAWAAGNPALADTLLEQFIADTEAAAGLGDVPNVWRSARDLDNVDGELRSAARTLRFSLGLVQP